MLSGGILSQGQLGVYVYPAAGLDGTESYLDLLSCSPFILVAMLIELCRFLNGSYTSMMSAFCSGP